LPYNNAGLLTNLFPYENQKLTCRGAYSVYGGMTDKGDKYILCFDDSGNRNPDKNLSVSNDRTDGMDWFALGGVLVKHEDVDVIAYKLQEFKKKWRIDYPLHSTKIRGKRKAFSWLNGPNGDEFYKSLEVFLLSLPIISIACVIHRPGYVARYKDTYDDRIWLMCKTTFSILIERAAKYADSEGRKLEIYFERSGKKEDSDIEKYLKELKTSGNPFNKVTSGCYNPYTSADYTRVILGDPSGKTKQNPLVQIADLVLYPMVVGGYRVDYQPFKKLVEHEKIIDCFISEEERAGKANKYSCFEGVSQKDKGPNESSL